MALKRFRKNFLALVLLSGCAGLAASLVLFFGINTPFPRWQVFRGDDQQFEHSNHSTLRLHYRYRFLLRSMGYSDALHPASDFEKALLDLFFASAQRFAVSARDREVMDELLIEFRAFCVVHNFTFFLYYGSLLGAYRHHGPVPWDDDIDVMAPVEQKPRMMKLLSANTTLKVALKRSHVAVVFFTDPRKCIPSGPWAWPYIEVHFYNQQGGHLRLLQDSCPPVRVNEIFPLTRVPFGSGWMPAPRCTDRLVLRCYTKADSRCCTGRFDHREDVETNEGGLCVECRTLQEVFPFLTARRRKAEAVMEELRLNGKVVATQRVHKPSC